MASAAVVLWAAATLPPAAPADAALVFAAGLLPDQLPAHLHAVAAGGTAGAAADAAADGDAISAASVISGAARGLLLQQLLAAKGVDLVWELGSLSPMGRVCALRGLSSLLGAEALCVDLVVTGAAASGYREGGQGGGRARGGAPWTLLLQGLLPAACAAVTAARDEHYKFHAMCFLHNCIARCVLPW